MSSNWIGPCSEGPFRLTTGYTRRCAATLRGLVLGHGVRYLWEFWYLTVYYVIPWLLAPGMTRVVDRGARSH